MADFGLAKFEHNRHTAIKKIEGSGNGNSVSLVGTLRWLAPECFDGSGITMATDMWAMGMCAYEVSVIVSLVLLLRHCPSVND